MEKTTVELGKGMSCTIRSGNHTYYSDEPAAKGGADRGPMPTELLLGALGSCVAITLRIYADRKGWPLEGVKIAVDFQRFRGEEYEAYEGDAGFIHEFREAITLEGPLTEEQKERLLDIATKCPVRRAIELPAFFKEMDPTQ